MNDEETIEEVRKRSRMTVFPLGIYIIGFRIGRGAFFILEKKVISWDGWRWETIVCWPKSFKDGVNNGKAMD